MKKQMQRVHIHNCIAICLLYASIYNMGLDSIATGSNPPSHYQKCIYIQTWDPSSIIHSISFVKSCVHNHWKYKYQTTKYSAVSIEISARLTTDSSVLNGYFWHKCNTTFMVIELVEVGRFPGYILTVSFYLLLELS